MSELRSHTPPQYLTVDECLAWVERYKEVPFVQLPLVTSADNEASPLKVLSSLAYHVQRLSLTAKTS
jgi:hypothetical protein